jgi:uncharacterized membrane protein YvlD (DUF360 family)
MIRLLIRTAVFLVSAALGLLVAAWLVPDVTLTVSGFVLTVIIFAVLQSVLAPFILKITRRHAPAFLGGIGLLSTFVALLIASLVAGGISIRGVFAWVLATLIVWLVTALGAFLLPTLFLKKKVADRRSDGI